MLKSSISPIPRGKRLATRSAVVYHYDIWYIRVIALTRGTRSVEAINPKEKKVATATGIVGFDAWIVATVRKHVIAQEALAGGDEGICVEESAPLGAIIPALEIIQPGSLVAIIA